MSNQGLVDRLLGCAMMRFAYKMGRPFCADPLPTGQQLLPLRKLFPKTCFHCYSENPKSHQKCLFCPTRLPLRERNS
jgi:ribosomal protein L40E